MTEYSVMAPFLCTTNTLTNDHLDRFPVYLNYIYASVYRNDRDIGTNIVMQYDTGHIGDCGSLALCTTNDDSTILLVYANIIHRIIFYTRSPHRSRIRQYRFTHVVNYRYGINIIAVGRSVIGKLGRSRIIQQLPVTIYIVTLHSQPFG